MHSSNAIASKKIDIGSKALSFCNAMQVHTDTMAEEVWIDGKLDAKLLKGIVFLQAHMHAKSSRAMKAVLKVTNILLPSSLSEPKDKGNKLKKKIRIQYIMKRVWY